MTDANKPTDPVSLPMDVKRKLLAARDALTVGDLMEAHHQIYSIASPNFNKLADEVWTALETPTHDSPSGARAALNELHQMDQDMLGTSSGEPGGQPPKLYRLQSTDDKHLFIDYDPRLWNLILIPQPPTKEPKHG